MRMAEDIKQDPEIAAKITEYKERIFAKLEKLVKVTPDNLGERLARWTTMLMSDNLKEAYLIARAHTELVDELEAHRDKAKEEQKNAEDEL